MGPTLGEILPLAIGIAISPVPIIAVILMLITPKARSNGLGFLVGWMLGLAIVGAIALILADTAGVSTSSGPSTAVSVITLALGLLMLLIALRQWQSRPAPGEEAKMPKWMASLDSFTTVRSVGVGAVLSGVNPKNLILNLSAASIIAEAGLSAGEQAVALAVLVVIGSLGIIAPVAVYLFMGDRAGQLLSGWKTWLAANNATVMFVLFLVFGVNLIGKGISGLSA